MKTWQIQCGYLPLVDSAPLIIAQQLRFAAEEGLELSLVRQPSWSALRDRLTMGQIEFAHMLSPMPVAMAMGLGGVSEPIDALMVLSVNGSVIGVSQGLAAAMGATGWVNGFGDPRATSRALFAAGPAPIRIGVPFPFSMHRVLLDYWLSQDPAFDVDRVEIRTVPPPQMAQAVKDGLLDMFCVGEPWGTRAVQQSDASLVLPTASIWRFAPEKVLAARHDWVREHPRATHALIRAIYKAATWLADPKNTPLAVEILARSQHLDLPHHAIDPALTGFIRTKLDAPAVAREDFIVFNDRAANFPWRSQAKWIAGRLAGLHGLDRAAAMQKAAGAFRSDLYRAALSPMGVNMPLTSEKVEGALSVETAVRSTRGQMILGPDPFFDGAIFDPDPEYLPKK